MKLAADTHVHMYGCYDAAAALRTLAAGLRSTAVADEYAAFLVERSDCHWFRDVVCRGDRRFVGAGVECRPAGEPGAAELRIDEGGSMFLFAGRQVATEERIEVLGLAADLTIPDGLPAERTIEQVLDAGAVAVLSWAPGKWFGVRGALVRRLYEKFSPCGLLLADTGLRPALSPEPPLLRRARREGVAVLAGSDPLPFSGDERRLGSYASVFETDFDARKPVSSARRALSLQGALVARAGRRCSWPGVVVRLVRNELRRRRG